MALAIHTYCSGVVASMSVFFCCYSLFFPTFLFAVPYLIYYLNLAGCLNNLLQVCMANKNVWYTVS